MNYNKLPDKYFKNVELKPQEYFSVVDDETLLNIDKDSNTEVTVFTYQFDGDIYYDVFIFKDIKLFQKTSLTQKEVFQSFEKLHKGAHYLGWVVDLSLIDILSDYYQYKQLAYIGYFEPISPLEEDTVYADSITLDDTLTLNYSFLKTTQIDLLYNKVNDAYNNALAAVNKLSQAQKRKLKQEL